MISREGFFICYDTWIVMRTEKHITYARYKKHIYIQIYLCMYKNVIVFLRHPPGIPEKSVRGLPVDPARAGKPTVSGSGG